MTTFTTEDRIIAEKDGSLTINVNAGSVTLVNKDLTDEEIVNIGYEFGELGLNLEMIRAILKKAQEK
jgi:hypothetical protein